MVKPNDPKKDGLPGKVPRLSVVAEDQNWRSYVAKELNSADAWNADWGFLSADAASKFFF